MDFRILGPLDVVDGGHPIGLGPPKQRALLALLLIHANQVVSLDRLIDQLWGEVPPPRATASLQAYVSHLRRALEPQRNARDPARVLVTRPPGYVLNVDRSDVDAARFESAATEGRRLLEGGQAGTARDVLRSALVLWRGGALEEFTFEPFAQPEIRRLEELRLAAIEDCVVADLALGHHAGAVPELEALVAEHPGRERLWGLLMVALYRCGRQGEALRAYQAARQVLREQLGVAPGPELQKLEAEVLAQAPSLDWQPTGGRPAPRTSVRVDRATGGRRRHADEPAPLIGRDEPLSVLSAALDDALRGRGRVMLLLGDPGIGKTRLARELAAGASAQGVQVAWGNTHEGAAAPAFWPWVQLLRPLMATVDAEELRMGFGAAAGDVAQILPEVKVRIPGIEPAPPLDPDTARFRVHGALSSFLLRFADRAPLLVVLDDLHWADDASLELLEFLARRLRTAPILVVGTYRPLDVPSTHPLSRTLAVLSREEAVERVALRGLEPDNVAELMAATTGAVPAPATVSAVHDRTGGNPFFVSELGRLMVSERSLDQGPEAAAEAIPAGVGDVIRRRLARLPEQTNALLVLAAVLGRRFELRELAAAAALDLDRTIEELEPAVLSGVLEEDRDVVGQLRFSHALVQETVYAGLSAARRARLHGRVGRSLELLYGPDDDQRAPELARHFLLAAQTGEAERAFRYSLRAADASMRRFVYQQSDAHLGNALEVLSRLPAGLDRNRRELDVQTRRAVVLALTRGYAAPEVADASTRAHDLSSRVGDTGRLTSSLWSLWSLWVVRGELDAGVRFARGLLDLGERTGDRYALLGGHQAVGATAVHRGDLLVGREHLRVAIALADEQPDRSLADVFFQHPAVFCRGFCAIACCLQGDPDATAELSGDALELARALEHPYTLALALFFDAWLAVLLRDPARVVDRATAAIELCEDRGFVLPSAMSSVLRGWGVALQGDPDGGCAELTEGLARTEATGARMLRHFFLGLLAEAHWQAGRRRQAVTVVDQALAEAGAVGECFYEAELHRIRGEFIATLGGG